MILLILCVGATSRSTLVKRRLRTKRTKRWLLFAT